jgi:UDP-N-acetyl-D-galactosamine dehydrogenase
MRKLLNSPICVIGLGYVGLPLALAFSKKFNVLGYDKNISRIKNLQQGFDSNLEFDKKTLLSSKKLKFTDKITSIDSCKVFIITVPTPVKKNKLPDLKFIKEATLLVSKVLRDGGVVIYESTVYPGTVEEFCVPILEKYSKLNLIHDNNSDLQKIGFHVGYSPERINPGDRKHKLENIVKITSGSSYKATNFIDYLYKKIIKAGTYRAESIKVAEAAKVIENTQRDLNIAFVNELSIIFSKLNIDTESVLNAAGTKWNFLPFKPGFVGGHCISVDPYYLTYKSKQLGYDPKIILAGRKINDDMPQYVASKINKILKQSFTLNSKIDVLIMGITFKENCPDYRNSQSIILRKKLLKLKFNVDVYDPLANNKILDEHKHFKLINFPNKKKYNIIIFTVAHKQFKKLKVEKIKSNLKKNGFIFDLKYIFNKDKVKHRL